MTSPELAKLVEEGAKALGIELNDAGRKHYETFTRAILPLVLTPTQTEYGETFYGTSVGRWCRARLVESTDG